ncbi:MAG: DNA polymerase beta superfamily protein [Candidatus Heimdallarchaeota archaeon]
MNKHLKEMIKDRTIIVLMKFGSYLYGTNTENSDIDYKGIFMPTKEEIFLNKIPKSIQFSSGDQNEKNTKDDIDIELYSLHYFLELAFKGETVAIDMLHCNDASLVKSNAIWTHIHSNRSKFYTNSLKGFVGYCRKQAAKYGIKGSRIAEARKVSKFFEITMWRLGEMCIMDRIWGDLPTGEHIHFVTGSKKNSEEEFYQVCGKKMQKTGRVSYCKSILDKFINSYGHRALQAEKNRGIDWKAVSHAIRYAWQIKDLFANGDIIFPLKDADYLRKVKMGNLHYINEVAPLLEELMGEIELLSQNVKLPKKVNRTYWDTWLIKTIENELK